ncbi:transglycosylase domain-containing protein [Ureibacillus acetophenoni]|uniref:transglycosylase domain-containing protein n=1 Tax=Ureibacillus acetophenoni TaxID=614649 RepID=UPI000BE47E61|nr:transglycosylase domain-containing protein [Ureibacillus acetophenoni]
MKKRIEQLNEKIEQLSTSVRTRPLRIGIRVVWNLSLLFLFIIIIGFVFVGAVGAGYFASLVKDENLQAKDEMLSQIYNYEETSEIYFANNIYIGKLRTDLERRETSLDQVSPLVINAVLATEDEYFREHNGIVPKAVLRGLLQDFLNTSQQTGGSTLTQQLIKNQILTNEVSYERKAREILLAVRLEKFMTKDDILEAYLNIIPYGRSSSGRNIAGVETAARGIFGVSASELTLPQAAYIAGIPQAPFAYTPFTQAGQLKDAKGLQPGIDRMKVVLSRMLEVGYISESEYNQAISYDITKDFREPEKLAKDSYPWLTYELENRAKRIIAGILAEKDGIDPKRLDEEENLLEKYMILADRDIRSSGYRIYSTIDKDMYDAMQQAAENFSYYGHTFTRTEIDSETGEEYEVQIPVQVGGMLIENKTGRIISFVGGRDFEISELNYATQAYRSNGSTMKPLLAYGPALDYGVIGAGSPVVDVKFTLPGYEPSNYLVNEERGIMTAREALAHSQNLTALRLYDSILDRRPVTYLDKLGFSKLVPVDYESLAISIGAMTVGTTVEENTNAFAAFANNGQFIDAYMIEKIVDLDGNIIYEHETEAVDVFSPETAYMITDMLRDVLDYGTGARANSMLKFSSDFAAKTGTSQNYRDVWFVGYNPDISFGLWMGYDDKKEPRSLYQFNNTYYQPSTRVNMLWANFMNAMYDVNPELIGTSEQFTAPPGVVNASFCGISGLAPSDACTQAGLVKSDLFNRNFLPTIPDDSLISSSSVMIDGKAYAALDSTPREFVTENGIGLNPEFAKRMLGRLGGDASKLLPNNSSFGSGVVSTSTLEPDSGNPPAVTAILKGNVITWTKSQANDVIGYRVYDVTNGDRSLVATIRDGQELQHSISNNSSYIVVAVDITGLESTNSNTVTTLPTDPTLPGDPGEIEEPGNGNPGNGNGGGNGNGNPGNGNGGNGNGNGNGNNNGDDGDIIDDIINPGNN